MAKINETADNPKGTNEITGLEKVDSSGVRRQLPEQDKASVHASKSWHTLEAVIERPFEAGLVCALGSGDEKDAAQESDDIGEVRRTLLLPLMERSRTMTLLQRSVLGQVILATALQQVTAPHTSKAEVVPRSKNPALKDRSPSQVRAGPPS
jgi:hypothetical protein